MFRLTGTGFALAQANGIDGDGLAADECFGAAVQRVAVARARRG
jgi:hypothetical protein